MEQSMSVSAEPGSAGKPAGHPSLQAQATYRCLWPRHASLAHCSLQ